MEIDDFIDHLGVKAVIKNNLQARIAGINVKPKPDRRTKFEGNVKGGRDAIQAVFK